MKKIALLFAIPLLVFSSGCESFIEGWDKSPNSPTEATAPLLLTNAQVATIASYTGQNARAIAVLVQHCTGVNDQMFNVVQNYNIRENDTDNEWRNVYENGLHTAQTIINGYADGYPWYLGIAKIIKAMNLGLATDLWGDIPNSEALKGLEGETHFQPKFDAQQLVIQDVQKLLDEAIVHLSQPFSANTTVPGDDDVIFGGDPAAWIRTAWVLKARYALRLTKRDLNGAVNNALSFLNSAYTAGLTSTANDCIALFDGSGNAQNQWWAFEQNRGGYMRTNAFFVNLLKAKNDPRLPRFIGTDPAGNFTGAPMGTNDPASYSWVGPYFSRNNASLPLVTFEEAKFIEAEAWFRKGDKIKAAAAYNAAVIASVEKVTGTAVPAPWKAAEASETDQTITLEKIMIQKYIAMFTQPEVWSDWRRTGFPNLISYANATGGNNIPRRFPIPQSERINNRNAPAPVSNVTPVWWDE